MNSENLIPFKNISRGLWQICLQLNDSRQVELNGKLILFVAKIRDALKTGTTDIITNEKSKFQQIQIN